VQVRSPFGRNKLEQGQSYIVEWQTDGMASPNYYRDAVLADGPIAYYRFDENRRLAALDASSSVCMALTWAVWIWASPGRPAAARNSRHGGWDPAVTSMCRHGFADLTRGIHRRSLGLSDGRRQWAADF